LPGTNFSLLQKSVNFSHKKFYSTGPRNVAIWSEAATSASSLVLPEGMTRRRDKYILPLLWSQRNGGNTKSYPCLWHKQWQHWKVVPNVCREIG